MYDMLTSQFNDAISREGKIITSANGNTSYTCLFRINSDKNDTKSRITIYYSTMSNLTQGQLLKYKNNYYIAINQETAENEVYYKSDLLKMNTEINTIVNGYELYIKCFADDLTSIGLEYGTMITLLGGNLELITEDNIESRKLTINSTFISFGATWKIINLIYKDGICYVYVERTESSSTIINYTLSITANDTYNIDDTANLTATAMIDTTTIQNATITWNSSDTSIATITNSGQLECLASGTVTITATWIEHGITATKELTLSAATPPVTYTASISYTYNTIKIGGSSRTFNAVFTDDSTGTIISLTPVWNLTLPNTITNQITIYEQADNYIKLRCADDKSLIGETFQLNLSDSDNLCNTSLTITIESLF